MFVFAQEMHAASAAFPGWILGLVFLLLLVPGGLALFLLMKRRHKPTASRRCAGCGARLAADSSGALCSRCVSVLSASQLGSDKPSGPMIPALGPATAQGIQAGAPSPWGIQSPDATPTAAHAGPMPVPELPDLAARFPNLEILELLGKGGMGAVYKARQTKLDRLVALKVLPSEFNRDPTFAERFLREARALARLDHPGIVAVHDFGEVGGQPYFVMEFVEGANLRQVIRGGDLRTDQTFAVVTQVCEALQFAHDEGIIHRDIKPENILLDKKGRVKIADFGLAKLLGPERIDHTLTATHLAMGTLNYMAPEQLENAARVDHRADIYSLGVVFYEMLTGQVPRGKFDPPSQKAPVDARLDAVVLRALESDPERRYQRVSELQAAMAAVGQTFLSADRPPGRLESLPHGDRESNVGTSSFQSAFRKIGLNLDVEAIKRHVEAPAIWLMVIGVLTMLISLVGMVDLAIVASAGEISRPSAIVTSIWVLLLLNLPVGFLIILGARKMLNFELFDMARVGCILALIPLGPLALLGIPVGIWALMILLQPRVRAVFRTDLEAAPIAPVPERIRTLLIWPRRALLVGGLAIFVATGFILAGGIFLSLDSANPRRVQSSSLHLMGALAGEGLAVANLLTAIMMFVASRSMATCHTYGLARLGCKLALLPLSLAVPLTFPIGLWALRVLKKPTVREAFGLPVSKAEWHEDEEATPSARRNAFNSVLYRLGYVFHGGGVWYWFGYAFLGGLIGVVAVVAIDPNKPGLTMSSGLAGLVLLPLLRGICLEASKILRPKPKEEENADETRQPDSQEEGR